MNAFTSVLLGATAMAVLTVPSAGREHDGTLGAVEQILRCDGISPGQCTVRCTASGVQFFESTQVRRAFLKGLGGHTLLQLQQGELRSDVTSVLVGALDHCSLDGLRDPGFGGFGAASPEP